MNKVFLGIGTNLNKRESNINEAVARIEEHIGKIIVSSSVYETEPWGFQSENEFLNMVVKVETNLAPSGLLGRINMIESLLGRVRRDKHYASRVIDIDILLYENMIINEISLKIPHPLLQDRLFVLIPLCEIEPDFVHPVSGKTITELLGNVDRSDIKLFK